MGTEKKTALRACSSSTLEEISRLRLVVPLSLDDPGPWGPAAVEPSTCLSEGQDLANWIHLFNVLQLHMSRSCTDVQ